MVDFPTPSVSTTRDLTAWLTYIEGLHPKAVAMGLERVNRMITRLQLHPDFRVIVVAGTNGKGSTCAMLEQIYIEAGYQVGCYTSPHLLRYNERVRVNGVEASDEALCEAFSVVDAARAGEQHEAIQLTYFEVGTLAAIWHFMQSHVDVAILEVGMGGRLDAVNAFSPDCSIVTSIDLDHVEFLGDTREKIGYEKAGIFRASVPAICGDVSPPKSLISYAKEIQADLKMIQQDFGYQEVAEGWQYLSQGRVTQSLPIPSLSGHYQINNAACAVTAVTVLQSFLPVPEPVIFDALQRIVLSGRFQTLLQSPTVIVDVAHNPHAARALAENLKNSRPSSGKTHAVFAMLADKDIKEVVVALRHEIDDWFVASIEHVRGASATDLAKIIVGVSPSARVKIFNNASLAYRDAYINSGEDDRIIAFGSFFTVASVMQIHVEK